MRQLSFQAFGGGIGCGAPRHFHHAENLLAAAIRKHGQAGFEKKQQARQQRESKKRQRESDAELQQAPPSLSTATTVELDYTPPPVAAPGPGDSYAAPIIRTDSSHAPQTAAVAPQELAALRKSLLKLSKQALAFTESGGPKAWRVEVPGIQRNVFAALARWTASFAPWSKPARTTLTL